MNAQKNVFSKPCVLCAGLIYGWRSITVVFLIKSEALMSEIICMQLVNLQSNMLASKPTHFSQLIDSLCN